MIAWRKCLIVEELVYKFSENGWTQILNNLQQIIYAGVHSLELFSLMASEFLKINFLIYTFSLEFEKQVCLTEIKVF